MSERKGRRLEQEKEIAIAKRYPSARSTDGALIFVNEKTKQKVFLSTALMRKIRVVKFGLPVLVSGDKTYLHYTDFSRARPSSG